MNVLDHCVCVCHSSQTHTHTPHKCTHSSHTNTHTHLSHTNTHTGGGSWVVAQAELVGIVDTTCEHCSSASITHKHTYAHMKPKPQ